MTGINTIAVIGAGQAGAQAAQMLRQAGFGGQLYLIGNEPHAPYQRPPLSKTYLAGALASERLALLPDRFYVDNAIECLFGVRVTAIDADGSYVTLSDGATLDFDRAVITTGSRSRALPLPGAELEGVFGLRSMGDVDRVRPHLVPGGRAIIIGGGYIGLEVAASVRGLGLDVRVIEAADRVMARTAPEAVSRFFEALHRTNGVTIETGTGVAAIEREPSGELTVATTGGRHAADWVLVAVGGQPNVELARAAGLATDNGITVDAHCRTSAPQIFAAGDCTNFPSARYGRRIRLESVQNAIDQAKAAALGMLGKGAPYDPVPWFWSDQYDAKYQIAGLGQFADAHVVRGDPGSGGFSVAHLRDGKLIALDAVNRPRDYMEARRMVPTALDVDPVALADADVPLGDVVVR